MNVRPKRVPRLWCARMGLLPFDVVLPGAAGSNGATCRQPPAASEPKPQEAPPTPNQPDAERRMPPPDGKIIS